ncbi:MAG: UDP-4-amino-4,6-dideoxy-N-acetyl-beta-L-altrosamine transaminase, partial [Alphaproteobacteria bacterium]|nr:UDP-4-amino-4,6-dideoxy-N-acetyl-beta-L-altrosamine transaminase [Alphaproteobacteria bacterium]
PYGRQQIDDDDIDAVVSVLRGDWLTTGPAVEAFETTLARAVDARFAVACSSGTAALQMAALACGVKGGDSVIVPTLTFLATANAPHHAGAEVIFADVDPDNGLMTAQTFREALAKAEDRRIKAVFPVHLNGQTCDLEAIAEIARQHDITVVHDAAHSLGGEYNGGKIGSDGAPHAFSFHPVKTVAMGEGGAVTTNDASLAQALRTVRNHGMTRESENFANPALAFAADGQVNPWYYEMPAPGFNFRVSDLNCALGVSQLAKLDRFVARRRALVARYDALIGELAPVVAPVSRVEGCWPAWHLYVALIDFPATSKDRAAVMRALKDRGIGTMVHYLPVHRQPYYQKRYGEESLPGAVRYYERALSLPLFPDMRDDDVERVLTALAEVLGIRTG